MSPEIFASHWYDKFCHLLNHYNLRPKQRNEPDPSWMCIFCIEGVEYVRQFKLQAQELRLRYSDYPIPSRSALQQETPPRRSIKLFAVYDQLGNWKENPFLAALFVTYVVDDYVVVFQKVKLGARSNRLPRWQLLPLRWRQAMNELFENVEKGREVGWWDVSDKIREVRENSNGETVDRASMRSAFE